MIRIEIDKQTGHPVYVDGEERQPVQDEDVLALLGQFQAVQTQGDALIAESASTSESGTLAAKVAALVAKNVVRLLRNSFALTSMRIQEIEDELAEVVNAPPPAPSLDGYILISIDEAEKAAAACANGGRVLFSIHANMPRDTPERAGQADEFLRLATDVSTFANGLGFRVAAAHEAEDRDTEGDPDDDQDPEDDGDDPEGEHQEEGT